MGKKCRRSDKKQSNIWNRRERAQSPSACGLFVPNLAPSNFLLRAQASVCVCVLACEREQARQVVLIVWVGGGYLISEAIQLQWRHVQVMSFGPCKWKPVAKSTIQTQTVWPCCFLPPPAHRPHAPSSTYYTQETHHGQKHFPPHPRGANFGARTYSLCANLMKSLSGRTKNMDRHYQRWPFSC